MVKMSEQCDTKPGALDKSNQLRPNDSCPANASRQWLWHRHGNPNSRLQLLLIDKHRFFHVIQNTMLSINNIQILCA